LSDVRCAGFQLLAAAASDDDCGDDDGNNKVEASLGSLAGLLFIIVVGAERVGVSCETYKQCLPCSRLTESTLVYF